MSVDMDSKVVGYVSYKPGRGMFCIGEDHACLVTGSMAEIRKRSKARGAQILEARFGEIVFAIELGGAYAFDLSAYRLFYPLAQKARKPWNLPHPDTVRLDLVYVGVLNRIPA